MFRRQFGRRYRRILFFGIRLIASFVWWQIVLGRILSREYVRGQTSLRMQRFAREFRGLAIEMGGVLIKLGQFLSARVDVLPEEVTSELSGLQDKVPPESLEAILTVVEEELGPIDQSFAFFDKGVQAAASLGQVHSARLCSGDPVVVKVQRLGIRELVDVDLAAVRTVVRLVGKYPPIHRRMDLPALLDEFARTLYEELDYLAEADNAETFAENFSADPFVYVPKPYRTHTTRCVLVLEDVASIKITDFEAMEAAGIDRGAVARRLFQAYLQQIFYDGFFHADPHPGNLFVQPLDWNHGNGGLAGRPFYLVFVDFGMVGHITPTVKRNLRELVIGLANRDAARVVQAYNRMGFLLPSADLKLIEKATTEVFDRFWGMSMGEFRQLDYGDMGDFFEEYRDLLFDMPFQIPQNFIYLGRMFGILSGMATQLDPDFNIFAESVPFARQLMREEMRRDPAELVKQASEWGQILLRLPGDLRTVLKMTTEGDLKAQVTPDKEWRQSMHRLDVGLNRLLWGVGGSALLISGVVLSTNQQADLAYWFLGGAGLALVRLIWLGRRLR
jgi:predicted unusual protein kinase regulating ubiquinone biosynthesis (AarF/ABC1/UbiB family)